MIRVSSDTLGITTDNSTVRDSHGNDALLAEFNKNYPVKDWLECCFFTEDFIKDINRHWMKFEPPPRMVYYVLASLYFIVMVIGMFGNVVVIAILSRCSSLRTPANTLILHLAISDLVMMSMIPLLMYNCINFGPAIGRLGCKLYGFMGGLSGTVSICLLAAISYDRFYVIQFPLRKLFDKKHVGLLIGLSWSYGVVFSMLPALDVGLGTYVPEAYFISCSFDYVSPSKEIKTFILCYFMAAWVLPLLIISFSYWNIVRVVLNSKKVMKRELSTRGASMHVKKTSKMKQEIKLAVTVLLVIFLWLMAWTPYATVALLGVAGKTDSITPAVSLAPALFCKLASCVDPYMYAFSHPKIRKEIEDVLSRISRPQILRLNKILRRRTSVDAASDAGHSVEETVMVSFENKQKQLKFQTHEAIYHL